MCDLEEADRQLKARIREFLLTENWPEKHRLRLRQILDRDFLTNFDHDFAKAVMRGTQ